MILPLIKDAIREFGGYLNKRPNSREFPREIVWQFEDRLERYWEKQLPAEFRVWSRPCLKGIFFGSMVGSDLSLYVDRFIGLFDILLIREPLSKIFLLASVKTPRGFYEELVSYLNVLISIEDWLKSGIVRLYPPFYLLGDPLHRDILISVDSSLRDRHFIKLALSCPDRGIKGRKLLQYYESIFRHYFNPHYLDLSGGISSYTKDYILRTMAQDVSTALYLSRDAGALPITCLGRHLKVMLYRCGKSRQSSINLPVFTNTRPTLSDYWDPGYTKFRNHLKSILTDTKAISDISVSRRCFKPGAPISFQQAVLYRNDSNIPICLKLPFYSNSIPKRA